MHYTTSFTLICHDLAQAGELMAMFNPAAAPDNPALLALLDQLGIEQRGLDLTIHACSQAGVVLDAVIHSGAGTSYEFISPLASIVPLMQAEIVDDDGEQRTQYGYIDGKKGPSAAAVKAMQARCDIAQLGRVGRMIERAAEVAANPSLGLLSAINGKKKLEVFQALLEQGADPNTRWNSGGYCLNSLIGDKRIAVVKLMLEHGADPNLRGKSDEPPLYLACRFASKKIVDLLLASGADPNERYKSTICLNYAIEMAIYDHAPDTLKALIAHGAKTSGLTGMANLIELNASTFESSFTAKVHNKIAICEILLQDPVLMRYLDKHRAEVLAQMEAGFNGLRDQEKAEAQQDYDAVVSYVTLADGQTKAPPKAPKAAKKPLPVEEKKNKVVKIVAQPSPRLLKALDADNGLELVKRLLDEGENPNARRRSGEHCLARLISHGRTDAVKLLLEHGADPTLHNPDESPYLVDACRYAGADMVTLLLEHGADPNRRRDSDSDLLTYPIQWAVNLHAPETLATLIAHGAKSSGLPHLGNLVLLNATSFERGFRNKIGVKRPIFDLLLQDPSLRHYVEKHRDLLLELVANGFRELGKTPGRVAEQACEELLAYIRIA